MVLTGKQSNQEGSKVNYQKYGAKKDISLRRKGPYTRSFRTSRPKKRTPCNKPITCRSLLGQGIRSWPSISNPKNLTAQRLSSSPIKATIGLSASVYQTFPDLGIPKRNIGEKASIQSNWILIFSFRLRKTKRTKRKLTDQ